MILSPAQLTLSGSRPLLAGSSELHSPLLLVTNCQVNATLDADTSCTAVWADVASVTPAGGCAIGSRVRGRHPAAGAPAARRRRRKFESDSGELVKFLRLLHAARASLASGAGPFYNTHTQLLSTSVGWAVQGL